MKTSFQYALACLLPATVAVITWSVYGQISAANIALLYLFLVMLIAIYTSTRPALLAALVSFLAFNISYTEPQGTLLVLHRQDLLMILLFLLVALIVGALAGRLREQLRESQIRQRLGEIQIEYTATLASAIQSKQVLHSLRAALDKATGEPSVLQELPMKDSDWQQWDQQLQASTMEQIRTHLAAAPDKMTLELVSKEGTVYVLHDGNSFLALVLVKTGSEPILPVARLMAQQATNALSRIRLANELKSEQQEKENELIRSSLLSSLSHDFRTPLTSMMGASSTLLELGEQLSDAERSELLHSIRDESQRLNSYTLKLLDMAQLGRGQYKLNRTTIDIDELIYAVLKRVRLTYPHEFVQDSEADLPAIEVHSALIEQALYNVIENACKFSPAEKPIIIHCRTDRANLIIRVEDYGPGIPDAEKEQVFEMFHSASRGDRRAAGSGLGLAISKGMIAAHGGDIRIQDSAQHSGCVVQISLPITGEAD